MHLQGLMHATVGAGKAISSGIKKGPHQYFKKNQIAHGVNNRRIQKFVNAGRSVHTKGAFIPSKPMNTIRKNDNARVRAGKMWLAKRRPTLADRGGKRDLLLNVAKKVATTGTGLNHPAVQLAGQAASKAKSTSSGPPMSNHQSEID